MNTAAGDQSDSAHHQKKVSKREGGKKKEIKSRSVFAYENVMVQQCPSEFTDRDRTRERGGKEMGKKGEKRERDREYVKYKNINLKDNYRLEKNIKAS